MKTPLNWINLYTEISKTLEDKWVIELAHLYSIYTAEIDATQKYINDDKLVVWKVIEAIRHPDSDHLNIVQVDLWTLGKTQIVCGATNVLDAKYVCVATPGTMIKWEFEIKSTRLRWYDSNWMICSEDELEFQEMRAPWIMQLENYFDEKVLESQVGKCFWELEIEILWLEWEKFKTKLEDVVFEIDNKFITNRPDLFSIEWNAREFWAIFDLPFKPYSKKYEFKSNTLETKIETDKVLAYNLLKIENIEAWISPFGITYSLYKSWVNSKFDLVDMTNYIMTELGQPMHAFDADKINWNICVRMAKDWEQILALNGETYKLSSTDMVIADDEKILAIAWIIGWADSAISETTKNIFIESACFDATTVRLTTQRLWVRTDSSARYEKSLDPLLTYRALSRALDFLDFIGKPGKLIGESEYIDNKQINNVKITLSRDFLIKKIGVEISNYEIWRILNALWFKYVESNNNYSIQVPSWRATKDISIKEDIAEEIGRINWYTNVPEIPIRWEFEITKKNQNIKLKQNIQEYFTWESWIEVYNYSFSNELLDEKIWINNHDDSIKIINAYSSEFSIMRRNMLANLLVNVENNKKMWSEFSFFEIANISSKNKEEFIESQKISGISYGKTFESFKNTLDWFFEFLIPWITLEIIQWTKRDIYPYFHPNKSWEIITSSWKNIWAYWFINPLVASNFELEDSKLIYFELDYNLIANLFIDNSIKFKEISKYPWIDRELNFVMDEKKPVWEVIKEIKSTDLLIKNVRIIDIYRNNEKLWNNKKSVTFAVLIQDTEKTITDEIALLIQNKIVKKLEILNIELRK